MRIGKALGDVVIDDVLKAFADFRGERHKFKGDLIAVAPDHPYAMGNIQNLVSKLEFHGDFKFLTCCKHAAVAGNL